MATCAGPLAARAAALAHITVRVRTAAGRPVEGARLDPGGAVTNESGTARLGVPPGRVTLVTTRLGFVPDTLRITLPEGSDTTLAVELVERSIAIEPVVVTSTRIERRIEDEP